MNNVFVPCGHVTCVECSLRLTHCHICRKLIEKRQQCYFPWEVGEGHEAHSYGVQHSDLAPPNPQPGSSTSNTTSATAPALPAASVDKPDGSAVAPASSKPQRSVTFNISESPKSDDESRAEDLSSEEGMENGEDKHPGAFDFFQR
ncbi:unnamed protein product [Hymenolepis diminuta]|uniref:RING-type domain-containing protein n=1 Tax=Hymenolepis diminuta TaxID=6216 RepID=A0A0R3SK91_HYMDI|nr:unnamed protein product [Hymenolepis diminuta]